MGQEAYIELCGISKRFGAILANDNISLSIRPGEIHALVGENGSGKTTLMQILAGIYTPDSGEIRIEGRRRTFAGPKDAMKAGIGFVRQHAQLADALTVWETLAAGMPSGFLLSKKRANALIRDNAFLPLLEPDKRVSNLTVAEKQALELLRVLSRGARVLILDEPTSVLSNSEADELLSMLQVMKGTGRAIVLITHKLHEVVKAADFVTVMRKGRIAAGFEGRGVGEQELARLMADGDTPPLPQKAPSSGRPVLTVSHLSVKPARGARGLKDISFTLNAGEILGIAGAMGQKELFEALSGLRQAEGSAVLGGKEILALSVRERTKCGLSFVPENRIGLAPGLSVRDNVMLRQYWKTRSFLLKKEDARREAEKLLEKYHITPPDASLPLGRFSGGNIQKLLLGRELSLKPKLFLAAYPARGLDIHAAMQIYSQLLEAKKDGLSVLLACEELETLFMLCDRIMILQAGKALGIWNAEEKKEIQRRLAGGRESEGRGC